jgi:hypothetical protein
MARAVVQVASCVVSCSNVDGCWPELHAVRTRTYCSPRQRIRNQRLLHQSCILTDHLHAVKTGTMLGHRCPTRTYLFSLQPSCWHHQTIRSAHNGVIISPDRGDYG